MNVLLCNTINDETFSLAVLAILLFFLEQGIR